MTSDGRTAKEIAEELRDHTAPEYVDGRPSATAFERTLFAAADLLESQAAEIARLREALQEILTRLKSAANEVDCFNVYESRDLARAALSAIPRIEKE